MDGASQGGYALDDDGAVDLDVDEGAHLLEKQDQIDDLWFDGGVGDDGRAVGEDRGKEQVLRRSDAGERQSDMGAGQSEGLDLDGANLFDDLRTHRAQPRKVEVHGAFPDPAAAGERDDGLPDAVQERSHHEDRDAVHPGVRLGERPAGDLRGGDADGVGVEPLHPGAELREHAEHDIDLDHAGYPRQGAGLVGEQGRDEEFRDRVLRSGHFHGADERLPACDAVPPPVAGHGCGDARVLSPHEATS